MSADTDNSPYIVTADLPDDLAHWATALRNEHFPPERNYLDAHVTLFHALPPSCGDQVRTALKHACAEFSPVEARLEGLMSLGRGTALKLSSPQMLAIRQDLAGRFHGLLTSQDQHKPRLHVTIQNKVAPKEAKELHAWLDPLIEPRPFRFKGLSLYLYRGGPWEHVQSWQFRGKTASL